MQNRLTGPIKHSDLTEVIIGVFYEVYNELGFGFLESVYENSFVIALKERGLDARQQAAIPVSFRGQPVGDFRADIIVDSKVIVELKAARAVEPSHIAQVLNYLKATPIEVGLLFNFGPRAEFKRLAFDNERKRQDGGATSLLDSIFS